MTAALRYEWARLTSIRSTYWIIGGALVFQAVLSAVVAVNVESSGADRLGTDGAIAAVATVGASTGLPPLVLAYVLGVLGVLSMGHEYRHGMIRATLTAIPNRLHVAFAKILTVALVSAVAAAVAVLIGLLNAVWLADKPGAFADADSWLTLLGVVLYTAIFSVAGLAVAGIVRNQTGAIVMLFALPIIVEPIISLVVRIRFVVTGDTGGVTDLAKFLPFDAGQKMYTLAGFDPNDFFQGFTPLGAVAGGLTFAIFVGLVVALWITLFLRRDA